MDSPRLEPCSLGLFDLGTLHLGTPGAVVEGKYTFSRDFAREEPHCQTRQHET